jgi:hypothetical protein
LKNEKKRKEIAAKGQEPLFLFAKNTARTADTTERTGNKYRAGVAE